MESSFVLQTTGGWSNRKPPLGLPPYGGLQTSIRPPLPNWEPGTERHSRGAPKPFRLLTASSPRNVASFTPRAPRQLLCSSLLLKTICLPEAETCGSQAALLLQPTSATRPGSAFLSFAATVVFSSYHASVILLQG